MNEPLFDQGWVKPEFFCECMSLLPLFIGLYEQLSCKVFNSKPNKKSNLTVTCIITSGKKLNNYCRYPSTGPQNC